jgi:hypothetical protein
LVAYYNLEKQKNNIEVLEKTSFISIRKEFVGIKTFLSAANQPYNQPSFPEMKSKSDSNPIAGKWI